jgi:hypothetical protein
MPKNKVNDPITDQEIAFAHLILSGAMTDRQAAEAAGLNPDSAAYTKAKPRVRAYMLEHRAAVQQQLVQQEADGLRRLSLDREQVLERLWELAKLGPEMTRNSITGQVKVMAMIVAILDLIPSRRAVSAEQKPTPAPVNAQIYKSAWLREEQAATIDPQPTPAAPVPACRGAQQEDEPAHSARPGMPWSVPQPDSAPEPAPASGPAGEAPSSPVPSQPASALRVPLADGVPPYVPQSTFVPDTRVPFSIKVNPFKHRR